MKFRKYLALLVLILTRLVQSETSSGESSFHLLSNRLQILEEGFRRMVTAFSKGESLQTTYSTIEADPVIRSIARRVPNDSNPMLSSENSIVNESVSDIDFLQSPVYDTEMTNYTSAFSSQIDDKLVTLGQVDDVVNDLKGAIKCSLAPLLDLRASQSNNTLRLTSTLLENGHLLVEWHLPSEECLKYLSDVLITIIDQTDFNQSSYQVAKECLTKESTSMTLIFPSSMSEPCNFTPPLLVECRTYSVEVTPNYMSIGARKSRVDVTIPPKIGSAASNILLMTTSSKFDLMNVSWTIHSRDCARLMTSVNLRIYEEKLFDTSPAASTIQLPRKCLVQDGVMFQASISFPKSSKTVYQCPTLWKPFDKCRNYHVEMEAEFGSSWTSSTVTWGIFTSDPSDSDSSCCNLLTDQSSSFTSANFKYRLVPKVDDELSGLSRSEELQCTWSISVRPNNTIWLIFSDFRMFQQETINVYDGTFRNSRLLMSHSKDSKPSSVRSSSNNLFIQIIREKSHPRERATYRPLNFTAVYASVAIGDAGIPYAPDCGGYIKGSGHIVGTGSSYTFGFQSFLFRTAPTSYCIWYIESSSENHTLLINNAGSETPFSMIVNDGWISPAKVLHNQTDFSMAKPAIYSYGSKIRVMFNSRDVKYLWEVSSIYTPECWANLSGPSGSINTPNYPEPYSNMMDCRWLIQVSPAKKIRIIFTYFETQESYDLVHIYDGSSIYSPLLLQASGKISSLHTVNSTSNQMLIRFTSNQDIAFVGFLAIYSSI